MPGVEALKADIRVRKESVEKLRGEVKILTDAVDNNRQKLQDSEESMTRAEKTLKKEKSVYNQVWIDRIAMEKKKQELETWLDDGGFDEENPEDMQLLASLEEEEEDLNKKLSGLLSAIEVSTQRQLQLEEQLQSTRANVNNLDNVIKEAEAEIEKKVSLFEREKSILASQEAEVKILDRMAEVPVSVLAPRFVPTATEAGVERSSVYATTRVRAHVLAPNVIDSEGWTDHPSCRSTIRSSLTDDREEDVSILDVNVPLTRSKKGKRLSSKGNDKTESTRKCWGPSGGHFTYAGCGGLLKDGRPCGLGLKARRQREITSSSPSSMSQSGTPGGRSRDRSGHTCVELRNHVQMYHFFVETLKPCHTLEVWDKAGRELFDMSAQEFFESFGQDVGKLHKFVSIRLASLPWGIIVIGNPSFIGSQRVLSFSSPGYSYSTTGPVSAKSPSPRVGVVEVIPGARSTAASDSPLVSSGPSSSSLQALKRLQSRVFDMGKDIAHVIASLKLEADEEEFVESVINLAG
ncbi:hypothetical protein R1sor_019715 [Riccia sorocarpa]|uniref:Uncharacterized protein n=1 Tax=Riccia sorocarpa TaxID=122646 RepID=A0ABD3IDA4_9MARC